MRFSYPVSRRLPSLMSCTHSTFDWRLGCTNYLRLSSNRRQTPDVEQTTKRRPSADAVIWCISSGRRNERISFSMSRQYTRNELRLVAIESMVGGASRASLIVGG